MKSRLLCLLCLVALFASCVSTPAPAPQPQSEPEAQAPAPAASDPYKNRAMELVTGRPTATATAPASQPAASSAAPAPSQPAPAASRPGMSPEDQTALEDYLGRLKFMVYFDEKAVMDPQIAKLAILKVDKFLNTELGVSIVDFEEIEKQKADLRGVFQKETGGSVDFIQYIAQKSNADIYLELSFTGSSYTKDGKFYATANGAIKVFDTSTAELYAAETFQMTSPAFSMTSERDALTNAVVASAYTTMPRIKMQVDNIKKKMQRGVPYQLIVQKTQDQMAIDDFEYELGKRLGTVEAVSYSAAETKFNIYTFKPGAEIRRAINDVSKDVGLTSMYRVSQFYKMFIYNTGM